MIKFTIPDIPPSLNKFAGRKNCWEYRDIKSQWVDLIAVYARPRPPRAILKAIVTITYYFKTKSRHDPDNYNGKMIMDGLVKAGILKDDSFDCVQLVLKGGYDKDKPRTEIEIEEV